MPGLVVTIGGKLDSSYKSALDKAATMAIQEQRRLANIRTIAPSQLEIVNRALDKLPAESLMRPRLLKMKSELTGILGPSAAIAGGQAATGFLGRFMEKMKGTGGSGMSQLISVFSNTASSLGAGISPLRILAQQAPNFLQAFTLMSKNAFATIVKYLFSPVLWAAAGATAIGSVFVYFGYKARKAAEDVREIGESFSHSLGPLERLISGLQQAADKARSIADSQRDFQRWLNQNGKQYEEPLNAADAQQKLNEARIEAQKKQAELVAAMEKKTQSDVGFKEAAADAKRYDEALKASQEAIDEYNRKFNERRVLNSKMEWVLPSGVNVAQPMIDVDGKKIPLDYLQNILKQTTEKAKFNESESTRQETEIQNLTDARNEAQKKADFYANWKDQPMRSGGRSGNELTTAQQAGAFALATMNYSLVDNTRKSEGHLQAIKNDIAFIKNNPGHIPGF